MALIKTTQEVPGKWDQLTYYAYFSGRPTKKDWGDVFELDEKELEEEWPDIKERMSQNCDCEDRIEKVRTWKNDKSLAKGVEVWSYGTFC